MPRTVEGIVEAHRLASRRVAKGLHPWKGTLMFMHTLKPLAASYESGGDVTAQQMLDGFKAAVAEVRLKVPEASLKVMPMEHEDLDWFIQELDGWDLAYVESSQDILDEFNEILDRFYDWCNTYRWWIDIA